MSVQLWAGTVLVEVSESNAERLVALGGYRYAGEDAREPEKAPEAPKRRPGRPRKES